MMPLGVALIKKHMLAVALIPPLPFALLLIGHAAVRVSVFTCKINAQAWKIA
jgi:hypothetical protein